MTVTRALKRQPSLFDGSSIPGVGADPTLPERFVKRGSTLVRVVRTRSGDTHESALSVEANTANDLGGLYDSTWLRSLNRPLSSATLGRIRLADLFSGCGGMSLGVDEAGRALGLEVEHVLAMDIDEEALAVYKKNFAPLLTYQRPVQEIVDARLGARLSSEERGLLKSIGQIDLLIGGPPCQGHSDLNNHTRRDDPKNALFDRMARFAEVVQPQHVVIENVPGVRHDKSRVFDRTCSALANLGYGVDALKIEAERIGVPQQRHRTVIVASRLAPVRDGSLRRWMSEYVAEQRSVGWACSDLLDVDSEHPFDQSTVVSEESQRRIDWLFEKNEHDLPDRLRPDCHRTKRHTYKSVYGRLFWDRPAWTITTGFQVMGQGRFLHPLRRRVITAHEAARLQFFPDFFDFGVTNRKGYARMIGNAVPSKLAYVVALELLRA